MTIADFTFLSPSENTIHVLYTHTRTHTSLYLLLAVQPKSIKSITHDHSPLVVLIPLVVQLQEPLIEMSNHHSEQQQSKGPHGSFRLLLTTIPHRSSPLHEHPHWIPSKLILGNKSRRKQTVVASWKTYSSLYERAVHQ